MDAADEQYKAVTAVIHDVQNEISEMKVLWAEIEVKLQTRRSVLESVLGKANANLAALQDTSAQELAKQQAAKAAVEADAVKLAAQAQHAKHEAEIAKQEAAAARQEAAAARQEAAAARQEVADAQRQIHALKHVENEDPRIPSAAANSAQKSSPEGRRKSSIVSLNVGGQIFTTRRDTLTSIPESRLADLVDNDPEAMDDAGRPFLDRDPSYFSIILNGLRDGDLGKEEFSDEGLEKELKYFGLKRESRGSSSFAKGRGMSLDPVMEEVQPVDNTSPVAAVPVTNPAAPMKLTDSSKVEKFSSSPKVDESKGAPATPSHKEADPSPASTPDQPPAPPTPDDKATPLRAFAVPKKEDEVSEDVSSVNKEAISADEAILPPPPVFLKDIPTMDSFSDIKAPPPDFAALSDLPPDSPNSAAMHSSSVKNESQPKAKEEVDPEEPVVPPRRRRTQSIDQNFLTVPLVVGGNDKRQRHSSAEYYDIASGGTWERLPDLPFPVSLHGCCLLRHRMYVAGGFDGKRILDSVSVYDFPTKKWSNICPLETPRRGCVCVAVTANQKIYVIGGGDGKQALKSIEMFDEQTAAWEPFAEMKQRRAMCAGAVMKRCIYVAGGVDKGQSLDSVECFDLKKNAWIPTASMLSKRWVFGLAVLEGYLYAVGGFNGKEALDSVERYDASTDSWELVCPMLSRRRACAVVTANGFIYAIGGYDGSSNLDTVERFDASRNSWEVVNPGLSVQRHAGAGVGIPRGIVAAYPENEV